MNHHKFLLPFKIVKHMIAMSMISMFMMMFMLMTIIYHRWETVGDRDSLLWPQCFLSQLGGLASASSSSFLLRLGVSAAPVMMGTRTTRATRGASTSMSAHSQKGWVDFFTLPYTLSEGVGWTLLAPTGWTLCVTMRHQASLMQFSLMTLKRVELCSCVISMLGLVFALLFLVISNYDM